MIPIVWKVWIYLSEPIFAILISFFVWQVFGYEPVGNFIFNLYQIILVLLGFCLTFNLAIYGIFFHRTEKRIGSVLKEAGYDRVFNYGFIAPLIIHFVSVILTFFAGQMSTISWFHGLTVFFLIYSLVNIITSVQNLSGFRTVCIELENEIDKVDRDHHTDKH